MSVAAIYCEMFFPGFHWLSKREEEERLT